MATKPVDENEYLDDFELALAEGIEDETLLENPGVRKFTISSYGADYTVDSLVKRMRQEAFKIPEFQRKFVWSLKHASKFIESLLMGLPVPGIFLYREAGTNEHLVIDGQQRLRTLQAFYNGIFRGKEFKLVGIREPWNGKTYKSLDASDVLKLDDSVVHATIFQQDQPQDVLDSIYFVFERINTGGIRLSPQEIRNCVSLGPFIALVKELNKNEKWRAVFGSENMRAKDEELIVRFLALYERGDKYARPMVGFLNHFAADMNKAPKAKLEELKAAFEGTIARVHDAIGGRAFRLTRALNAAAFDAIMIGLANRLKKKAALADANVTAAYDALIEDPDFRAACERATADDETVRTRLRLANEAFSGI